MIVSNKLNKMYMMRQQRAAETARTTRIEKARGAVALSGRPADGDRKRVTLAGLRFMGEEPHPSQAIDLSEVSDD